MRRTLLTLLLALTPAVAAAQQTTPANALPSDIQRMVVDRWNGENEYRSTQRSEIRESTEIRGNVSVLHGPLMLGGHVTGSVLVINGDAILAPTAQIDGDLIVVGGDVEGRATAHVGGSTFIYRESLNYREDGDRIVALGADGSTQSDSWWQRIERHGSGNWSEAVRVVQAGAYNRVEGLPIQLGPALSRLTPWGSVRFDAAAIVRTGSSFQSDRADVGHILSSEVRVGRERGIGIGGRVFNSVDPIESWQLSDLETALAAFLARRDYRDYYARHGGTGSLTLYGAHDLSLSASYGAERWSSRTLNNPFTLFNAERNWRPNPFIDEGLFHLGQLSLKFDTRTDRSDPGAGWFLNGDLEHGRGRITDSPPISPVSAPVLDNVSEYTRAFFDFRRYNRLGPKAQLNMRLVLGGWLGGDDLPLERRVSVDGPGALPGFGFRSDRSGIDVGNCNVGGPVNGTPAQCDRIALAQIEYRGNLSTGFGGRWEDWPNILRDARGDISWVLFADAGRGWLVGTSGVSGLTYDDAVIPPLATFRTDIGLGLDVAGIGIYGAKALSSPREPANFFVRLRHRF
jgi:hypothetical protein